MPDSRRVHATAMVCSVEDADRRDCIQTEGAWRFRRHGGLVFTETTGCYHPSDSALRGLTFWAEHPDAPPPPAPWNCPRTMMNALLCEGEPDAPALPLAAAVYVDGLDTGPVLEVCRDDHLKLRMFSMAEDIAMMTCHVCGHEPEFAMLAASADQATGDRYRLPAKASRAWIVEHSEVSKLGLVPIPADRLGGLSTHLRYEPDCDHDDCRCDQDESVRWNLEECVAVNIYPAELYG